MNDDNIRMLKSKFNEIKNMGYVKSVRKGSTGVGATFESLIGKNEESFEIPDFQGIEIKTRRAYSKSRISLFNAVPTGSSYYEVKRIRDTYGYPSKRDRNLKCLYAEVDGKIQSKVGLWYYFKLRVDKEKEKLILEIYDHNNILIDDTTYWDFDILKEKLLRKLELLALVKAWPTTRRGTEYFKYYKINFYILRGFDEFVDALENGIIEVVFKINSFTDEKRYGNVDSSGVTFAIHEEDLLELYYIYR